MTTAIETKDDASAAAQRRTAGREWLSVALIAAVATLPFLNKAFHIDDVLYLRVAEQILRTPLDPYHGVVLWDAPDGEPARLVDTDFNPPLWKYALAGCIACFGRDEWKLHLMSATCTMGSGLALLRLGRRFTKWPVWCVAMVLLGPLYLPGQNLMLEPPMFMLTLWAVECSLRAGDNDSLGLALLAGALLGAAVAVKYTAGLLLPVLIGREFFRANLAARTGRRIARMAVLAAPTAAFLAAWVAHNRLYYGAAHFGAHGYAMGSVDPLVRLRAVVRTIGAAAVFALPLLSKKGPFHFSGTARLGLCFAAVAWAALDLACVRSTTQLQGWLPTLIEQAHFFAFAANGMLALIGIGALAMRERHWPNSRLLILWATVLLSFNIMSVPFVAPRHLLLLFAPATWLLSAAWDRRGNATARWSTLGVSTLLGFTLAHADFQVAGHYRSLAKSEVARRVAAGPGATWFTGTWGFAYYAAQAGANPVLANPPAFRLPPYRAGDSVIHPALLSWGDLEGFLKKLPRTEPMEHWQSPAANPFRTLGPNINFYAVQGHSLPWCLFLRIGPDWPWVSLPPLDDTLVYRIVGQ